jgi:hypothetical protein
MTEKQFNAALAKLGYTNVTFGELIETNDRTVRRWASGQWPVPKTIALLLGYMLKENSDGA